VIKNFHLIKFLHIVTTAIFQSITSKSRNNLFDVLMTNIYVNQRKRRVVFCEQKEYFSAWDFTSYGIFLERKKEEMYTAV